jgi:hypothetical protein
MNLNSGRSRRRPVVLEALSAGLGTVSVTVAAAVALPVVVFPAPSVVPASTAVLAAFVALGPNESLPFTSPAITPAEGCAPSPPYILSCTGVINANCAVLFVERGGVLGAAELERCRTRGGKSDWVFGAGSDCLRIGESAGARVSALFVGGAEDAPGRAS